MSLNDIQLVPGPSPRVVDADGSIVASAGHQGRVVGVDVHGRDLPALAVLCHGVRAQRVLARPLQAPQGHQPVKTADQGVALQAKGEAVRGYELIPAVVDLVNAPEGPARRIDKLNWLGVGGHRVAASRHISGPHLWIPSVVVDEISHGELFVRFQWLRRFLGCPAAENSLWKVVRSHALVITGRKKARAARGPHTAFEVCGVR